MVDDNLEFRGDFDQLISALRSATTQFINLAKAQNSVETATAKLNDDEVKLTRTTEQLIGANQRLITTFKTVEGQERAVSARIVDTTEKAKAQQQEIRRLEEERRRFAQQAKAFTNAISGEVRQAGLFDRASQQEILNFRNAQGRLREFVERNRIAGGRINQIWQAVSRGQINDYSGRLRQLQNLLVQLRAAQVNLGAEAGKTFGRARREVERFNAQQNRARRGAEGVLVSWQSVGRLFVSGIFSRVLSQFVIQTREALQGAIDFSNAIARIQTIDQRGVPFERWARELRTLSDAFGLDIIDQADAAYQSLSNQVVRGAETFEFLRSANELALTGVATTEQSVKLLSSAINAFNLDVADTDQISSVFFKTVELGRNRIDEINDSFGRIAVPAGQLGLSLEETGAALATLTRQGVKPNEAFTQLNGIFTKILKPTTQMKELIESIGFESGEAAVRVLGFAGFMGELQKAVGGSSSALAALFNRQRALRGVFTLASQRGLNLFRRSLDQINEAGGDFNEKTALILANSGKQLEIEFNRIKNFFVEDVGRGIIDTLATVSNEFGGLSNIVINLSKVFAVALVPAILAGVVALGRLATVGTGLLLANPFIAAVTAIVTATAAIIAFASSFESALDRARAANRRARDNFLRDEEAREKALRETVIAIQNSFRETTTAIDALNRDANTRFAEFRKSTIVNFRDIASLVGDAFDDAGDVLSSKIKDINSEINGLQSDLESLPDTLADLSQTLTDQLFDFDQARRNPADQLQALIDKLRELESQATQAAAAGNLDLLKEARSSIAQTLREIDRLQGESLRTNEQNSEKRQRLTEQEEAENIRFARHRRDLNVRLQEQLNKEKVNNESIRRIRRQLVDLEEDHARKTTEIKTEREGLVDIGIKELDVRNEILRQLELQKKQILEIEQAEKQRIQTLQTQQLLQEETLASFRDRLADFQPQNIKSLFEVEDLDELQRQLQGRQALIQQTIDLLEQGGVTESERRRIESLRELLRTTTEVVEEQENRLRRQNATQRLREFVNDVEGQLLDLKNLSDDLSEARNRVSQNAQAVFEAFSSLIIPSEDATNRIGLQLVDFESGIRDLQVLIGSSIEFDRKRQIISPDQFDRTAERRLTALRTLLNSLNRLTEGQISAGDLARLTDTRTGIPALIRAISLEDIDDERFRERAKNIRTLLQTLLESLTTDVQDVPIQNLSQAAEEAETQIDQLKEAQKAANEALKVGTTETVSLTSSTNNFGDILSKTKPLLDGYNTTLATTIATLRALNAIQTNTTAPGVQEPVQRQLGGFGVRGSDRVPALLAPGEFVVNAKSASRFRSQLLAMNSGVQRFQGGGQVTNVGDVNVTVQASGSTDVDIERIGRGLRKAIRQGRVRF